MGFGLWLQLLLGLAAVWGTGSKETVLGVLGEATLLRIPPELRNRTREFSEAAWKKSLRGQQRKKFLLRFSRGNLTEFQAGRLRFHREDFSLEILNTSREDERLYEFSLSGGEEEEVRQLQLRVFEPVSHPRILILHREFSNGSCSLALLCSSERGDNVSYSWENRDNATTGVCSGVGAALNVSVSPGTGEGPPGCACTAQNPVSRRRNELRVSPEMCEERRDGGVPGVSTGLLVPLVALGLVVVVVAVVVVTFRATKGDPVTPQDSAGATIYAQVQKPKGIVPKATPASCTTIYAAATGPPLAPDGSPRSPKVSPKPRGQPPLSQEPTTVYASVTLPLA